MRKSIIAFTTVLVLQWCGQAGAAPKDDWSKATNAFQAAIASGKDVQVEQAATRVAADNSVRAVEFLVKSLRTVPQPGT